MPQDIQSIEDLISSSKGGEDSDESVLGKFKKKEEEIKVKDLEKQTNKVADSMGIPFVKLHGFPVSPDTLSLIEESEARMLKTACFYYDGEKIKIAATDPTSENVQKKLSELTEKFHCQGRLYMISENSWEYVLGLYKGVPKIREFTRDINIKEEDLNKFSEKFNTFKDLQKTVDNADITDIVTMIMAAAFKSSASDVHIEAEAENLKVRFRIDGVLHDVAVLSMDLWKKIISRLKMLARVKINITDRPQDGRFSIVTSSDRTDIRVSFLPTSFGESVVMRLLRSSAAGMEFSDLGLEGVPYEQLIKEIERPNGMIISTGPTGSGKTTTQYAILRKLNKPETKIITIEDPIEYQLKGINQTQTSKEYTFAKGLKSIVRQDPDAILVGEIRDIETAEIAIQASLTGHLVLSTIHTNDAAGTVPRFLSMGTKPFLLAPSLNAMIGQRLVRRVCDKCKKEVSIDDEQFQRAQKIVNEISEEYRKDIDSSQNKFYQGQGCEACQGIGYKGRVGIFEIMAMSKEIEQMILSGKVSEYDIEKLAIANGMIKMIQDGLLKAFRGVTTVEEIFRITDEK